MKKITVFCFVLFGLSTISYIFKQELLISYHKISNGNDWDVGEVHYSVDDDFVIIKRTEDILSIVREDLGYRANVTITTTEEDNGASLSIVNSEISNELTKKNSSCHIFEFDKKGALPNAIVFMKDVNLISWVYFEMESDFDRNLFFDDLCNSLDFA